MEDTIFLLVKCTVNTPHKVIHDAIIELQEGTTLHLTSTKKVKVLKTEIVKMNTRTLEN